MTESTMVSQQLLWSLLFAFCIQYHSSIGTDWVALHHKKTANLNSGSGPEDVPAVTELTLSA